MIERYCDSCGKPVRRNAVHQRIRRRVGRVSAEVTVAVDGTWNRGDVCEDCVILVVSGGREITQGQVAS